MLIFLLILGGGALIWFHFAIGWTALGLAAPLIMILCWDKRALSPLPPAGDTVDGLLSEQVLATLPRKLTIPALAAAVMDTDANLFMAMRFGLPREFVASFGDKLPEETLPSIWSNAIETQHSLNLPVVTSGCLTLAILRAHPTHEQWLNQYKLSLDDLLAGVRWREQLHLVSLANTEPILTGGVARDWSFGFTPLLSRYGRNISAEINLHGGRTMSLHLPSRLEAVQKMVTILSSGGHRSVVVVGPDGAGKTSVVHDFAEVILSKNAGTPTGLRYNQVFLLDPTSLIAAAPGRGEIEQLVQQILIEAAVAKNAIICLDNAELFFSNDNGAVDLLNILMPVIENNSIRLILTMDGQRLLELEQKNPNLFNLLERINIESANYDEALAAMEDRVIQLEHDHGVIYTFQALTTAYRLSERYVHDLAQPGASFKLLSAAANFAQNRQITAATIETALAESLGIKVGVTDDEAEKQKLINLEQLLHERVIGQDAAVVAVANALRRARAGVSNQSRPVGAFLFLGPTGVGKTELAKALAAIYYGGEDRLVRADMNQFTTPETVADLTADPATNPTSLTAQVMKNPFCVVLLDEIEKAHPTVLAALLQMLDEGVMRDTKSREVSFRDTIIVATSNAGADIIRDHLSSGAQPTDFHDGLINQLIDSHQFLPEFLNRFDDIVIFASLTPDDLTRVVNIIIAGINRTLEPQKIRVVLDSSAVSKLVTIGYDPRLGARPLRRIIQRTVENQVAAAVLAGTANPGDTLTITADQIVN
jgi:ATP-dependent Clp protease ATP-binding subunit ClpC